MFVALFVETSTRDVTSRLRQFAETWRFFDLGLTESKKERRGDSKRETLVTLWGCCVDVSTLMEGWMERETTVVPNQMYVSRSGQQFVLGERGSLQSPVTAAATAILAAVAGNGSRQTFAQLDNCNIRVFAARSRANEGDEMRMQSLRSAYGS